MSTTPLSVDCQMMCASGCAYSITGTSYTPPPNDPFGPAIGWTAQTPNLRAIAGGQSKENAVLVGPMVLAGTRTVAIVVAFRGTIAPDLSIRSIEDWLQDLMGEPITVNGIPGKIHDGIYDSVNDLYAPLVRFISHLLSLYPGAPVYVTGHSKGGGMASIFSAWVSADPTVNIHPEANITFASPMIGNQAFINGFPSKIAVRRYENYLDIVPFLSPSASFMNTLESYSGYTTWFLDTIIILFKTFSNPNWGYVPLGKLFFIKNGTVSRPQTNPCANDIAQTLEYGISYFSIISNAHSHLCGAGYMSGACNSMGVCPITIEPLKKMPVKKKSTKKGDITSKVKKKPSR